MIEILKAIVKGITTVLSKGGSYGLQTKKATQAASKAKAWLLGSDKFYIGDNGVRLPYHPNKISYNFKDHKGWGTTAWGLDFNAPLGTKVPCIGEGKVHYFEIKEERGKKEGYGTWVIVEHPNNIYTVYAHLDASLKTRKGKKLSPGETVGKIALTGNTTGPHLHFEVRVGKPWGRGSKKVDPEKFTGWE